MLARPWRMPESWSLSPMRLLSAVGALVAAGAILSLPAGSAASQAGATPAAPWCTPAGPLDVAFLPASVPPALCDLRGRTVTAGSVQVDVPAPGYGVSATDGGAGGESALRVLTDADGVVSISRGGVGAAALTTPQAAVAKPAACRDGAYSTMGYKFTGRFDWRLNPAGSPGYLGRFAHLAVMQATSEVARGANKCGLRRPVRLSQRYLGTTTKRPQITSAGSCQSGGDGVSVTGWMRLTKVLAYTCSYYRWNGKQWIVSESDMALSTHFRWFTAGLPGGCRYIFDLRGVVVHERGHTFGLGHVDSRRNASLTMSPYSAPCTTANRALGYGDYRGLSAMYGLS